MVALVDWSTSKNAPASESKHKRSDKSFTHHRRTLELLRH